MGLLYFFGFNNDTNIQNSVLSSMLVTIVSVFIIALSFQYSRPFEWLFKEIYKNRLNALNYIIKSDRFSIWELARFFILCMIITTFTMYFFAQGSIKILLSIIPGSNFLEETEITCKNPAATLFQNNTVALVAISLAAPLWIFILRQIRRTKTPTAAIRGTQSLLFYCYFSIALFISSYFVYIGCPRQPGLYLYISPETLLVQYFWDALMAGGPASIIIFTLDRIMIKKI